MKLCYGLAVGMMACASVSYAGCQDQYWQATAPKIINSNMQAKTRELCFSGFVVMHSGVTRTPLWVGEYLTKNRVQAARGLDRQDNFHEEERLPADERATLTDYRGSGYDRGHMAPNGDMANRQQQSDSFSLANMVPQSPTNNREVWRNLEEATRALVEKEKEAYVLTGPAFLGKTIKKTGKVFIPTHVYKVVYFPKRQAASAYFAPNDESGQVEVISVAALEQKIGINLLPTVSAQVKQAVIALPKSLQEAGGRLPTKPSISDKQTPPQAENSSTNTSAPTPDWIHVLLQILQALLK